jgi:hypothetical protein
MDPGCVIVPGGDGDADLVERKSTNTTTFNRDNDGENG